MSDSFETWQPISAPQQHQSQVKVLVTGAAGNIGSYFARHTAKRYDLRLLCFEDDDTAADLRQHGEIVFGDVTDLQSIRDACDGVDTVLHLAGNPSPSATWQSLRDVNIEGTYHTMVAAKDAGCRRVIFASSIHAVNGYPEDRQVMTDDPVNPGDLYGVSKCFGEAMGRYMACQHDLSVIAVRICAFQPLETAEDPDQTAMLDSFVSQRDLTQLFCHCIDDQRLRFAIVHGVSDNTFKRLDLTQTRELLGYTPQDDLSKLNPRLESIELARHHSSLPQEKAGIRDEIKQLHQ